MGGDDDGARGGRKNNNVKKAKHGRGRVNFPPEVYRKLASFTHVHSPDGESAP